MPQFKYIGKIDAFECPKTKILLKFQGIVGKKGNPKKKIFKFLLYFLQIQTRMHLSAQ